MTDLIKLIRNMYYAGNDTSVIVQQFSDFTGLRFIELFMRK